MPDEVLDNQTIPYKANITMVLSGRVALQRRKKIHRDLPRLRKNVFFIRNKWECIVVDGLFDQSSGWKRFTDSLIVRVGLMGCQKNLTIKKYGWTR
jgi:hypothetical protein